MSGERVHDLAEVRADGWFDRVISGVPALEKLCGALGEPLVALSLVAGFRIVSAAIDRVSGDVSSLSWVREEEGGGDEVNGSGAPAALRTEVLAVILGEADATSQVPEQPDADALRAAVGQRYLLLAPLFGLTLRRLLVADGNEARIVVFHDNIEEIVPLRQLRRFLRSRVIDVLQSERNRSVSIDLEEAEVARRAFSEGRFDEVVARLASWVAPLMVYHRTPEGSALEPRTRAEIGRALALLGEAYGKLSRSDEREETLRLAVQYGQDSPAAGELYGALGRGMMAERRYAEAIGPLRRALSLDPAARGTLLDLATCLLRSGRAVAALGCVRDAAHGGVDREALARVGAEVRAVLGPSGAAFEAFADAPLGETASSQ